MNPLNVLLLTVGITIFWGGWVGATLWGWFIVPLGVRAIGYWHSVGLSLLFFLLTGLRASKEYDDIHKTIAAGLLNSALIPAICLALGWLAWLNMA